MDLNAYFAVTSWRGKPTDAYALLRVSITCPTHPFQAQHRPLHTTVTLNRPFRFTQPAPSLDGKMTEENLLAFEEKFFAGELKPSLKSEEPSPEDTAEPVKVLKGKSFANLVLENGKLTNVSRQCMRVSPIWTEVGGCWLAK